MSGAAAQTVYNPGSKSVQVQVTASVGLSCGFSATGAPSGTVNAPNFDATGFTHDFGMTLNCTVPSRVAVVSKNGGLLTTATADTGYTNKAPYDVTLNLVPNAGAPATATCAASTLTTGSTCTFLGPATTTQGLRLDAPSQLQTGSYLRVKALAYTGNSALVAGSYGDTLTVTLSASP
jgi:hypothetical protein